MKTFFLQLFLSFWIAALGILVASTLLFPGATPGPAANFRASHDATSTRIVDGSIYVLAHGGCGTLQQLGRSFVLLRPDITSVCGDKLDSEEQALAQRLLQEDGRRRGMSAHIGANWVEVQAATGSDGQQWLLMQRTPYVAGSWFPPLPREALPASIIVTFILALFLTRPVRRLSHAVKAFAAGDLSVRLPVSRHWWSSVGGSDVRNLMIDFNHMADRVNALIEAQKLLVRDISHELRSPLARLRLALEMTREESQEDLPSLDLMEKETDRVNELIGQMLTLSLMESTRQLAGNDLVFVPEVIESLLPNLEFEARGRGCTVRYHCNASSPYTRGNRELLRRALENVIRNAIRYTATDTDVDIEVSSDSSLGAQDSALRVTVSDRGPGVPQDSLALIFRAFYRTDGARRSATGGFGVGLSIAERAVTLHGGRITASNRSAGGLRVEILLPSVEGVDTATVAPTETMTLQA